MNEHTVTGCAGTWRRKAVMPQRGTASPLWAPHSQGPPFVLSTLYVFAAFGGGLGILLACSFTFWSLGVEPVCPASRRPFSQRPFPAERACDMAWPLSREEEPPQAGPVPRRPSSHRSSSKTLEGNAIVWGVRARSMSRKTERARSPQGLPFT